MAVSRAWLSFIVASVTASCTAPNPAYDDGAGERTATSDAGGTAAAASTSGGGTSAASAATASGGGTSAGSAANGTSSADPTTAGDSSGGAASTSSSGDAEAPRVLLVTQLGDLSLPLDATLHAALLSLGAEVVLVEDVAVVSADADDVDLVVISETITAAELGAELRDVARPVVSLEGVVWVDMGMVPFVQWIPGSHVVVVDPRHDIAAGLVGEVTLLTDDPGAGLVVAETDPSADVIARAPDAAGPVAVFAFEGGEPMAGGFLAPAARVGLGADVDANGTLPSTSDLTPQGVTMFVAAVQWALP